MINLTGEELGILLEALDSWEKEPASNGVAQSVMLAMLGKEARTEEMDKLKRDIAREQFQRKRRVIMLKAKLLEAADEQAITDMISGAGAALKAVQGEEG